MSLEISKSSDDQFLKFKPQPKSGDAKWADIEDLINRWAKRMPKEAYDLEMYIRSTKDGLYDKKHGEMKSKTEKGLMRESVAIHPQLLEYIRTFYPQFLKSKEDLITFKKKFPKFKIAESV